MSTRSIVAFLLLTTNIANAANEPPDPLVGGAPSVTIEGRPAARQGDAAGRATVKDGASNVFINGRPAATVGDRTECGGTIVTGSSSVFINGKPVATGSSLVTPCTR